MSKTNKIATEFKKIKKVGAKYRTNRREADVAVAAVANQFPGSSDQRYDVVNFYMS
jgi:hypothetical protein